MTIRTYQRFEDIPLTRQQWNSLAMHGRTATIFQTHQWATAWWKSFGHAYRYDCMTAVDGNEVNALAPLMSREDAPRDWLFMAESNSDYCDFPITGNGYSTLEIFLLRFFEEHPDWNSLVLHNIPEASDTLACLQTLCEKHGLAYRLGRRIAAPEIVFAKEAGGYKHKYSVRRHCNRLEKLGRLEYEVIRDPEYIPGMLDVLYRLHIDRFRHKGENSLFERRENRDFYDQLARELSGTGWLHFSRLTLDGKPLAMHFGFEFNGTLTWYKPAFDVAYRHYSPGTVLIRYLIDYAQEHQLKTLDFTIGDESFKSRFCNATTYNRNIAIYPGHGAAVLHAVRRRSARLTKRAASLLGGGHASG